MPKGQGGGKTRQSQGVKAAQADVARIKKISRELLKKAGTDIKTVRKDVAKLKKAGIVSSRINARNYIPSKYMLQKIRKNADVLSGQVIPVKAPKSIRDKYVSKGIYEQRGGALIVPREMESQRAKISRGLVEVSRPLKWGEEKRLILPFKATDMEAVANKLQTDPTLDGLKEPDELFGFRLFGHNMGTIGFPSAEELADYILRNYQHLFNGKNGRTAVKEFQLIKFKRRDSQLSEAPEEYKKYSPRKNRPENGWHMNRRLQRDAMRKAKAREKESETERKNRLDKQRIRSAQNRQRKLDD